jgi:hypothetical protein
MQGQSSNVVGSSPPFDLCTNPGPENRGRRRLGGARSEPGASGAASRLLPARVAGALRRSRRHRPPSPQQTTQYPLRWQSLTRLTDPFDRHSHSVRLRTRVTRNPTNRDESSDRSNALVGRRTMLRGRLDSRKRSRPQRLRPLGISRSDMQTARYIAGTLHERHPAALIDRTRPSARTSGVNPRQGGAPE